MTSHAQQGGSLADLHYRLGQFVKQGDGKVCANGHAWPASERCFEGLALDCWPKRPELAPPHFDRALAERLQGKWDAEGEAYDRLWPDKKAYEAELARIDEQFEDINTAPDLARMQENG